MSDGRAFVKYHKERAGYGGASREFHELAASHLISCDDEIATLRAKLAAAERVVEAADALAKAATTVTIRDASTYRCELSFALAAYDAVKGKP